MKSQIHGDMKHFTNQIVYLVSFLTTKLNCEGVSLRLSLGLWLETKSKSIKLGSGPKLNSTVMVKGKKKKQLCDARGPRSPESQLDLVRGQKQTNT